MQSEKFTWDGEELTPETTIVIHAPDGTAVGTIPYKSLLKLGFVLDEETT